MKTRSVLSDERPVDVRYITPCTYPLGPASTMEDRDGEGSQGRGPIDSSAFPRADLHAEDAGGLCWAELLWWEGRPAGALRR